MPNRMLRDWTQSDKVDQVTAEGERFFTRLIMKADDYGCFWGDTRLLKANLFPLKLDKIREADITRWIAECVKAGLILFYEVEGKRYIRIQDFRQRLDKAKAKFPLPTNENGFPEVVNDFPAEVEVEQNKKKNIDPTDLVDGVPSTRESLYGTMEKSKKAVYEFFKAGKPDFPEPYVDLWNHFALSVLKGRTIRGLTDPRKKKLMVRIREPQFDFPEILKKATSSQFLAVSSWFTFEWLIKNENNYLKVLEGAYDNQNSTPVIKIKSNEQSYREQEGRALLEQAGV